MLETYSISALAGASFLTSLMALPAAMFVARTWNFVDHPIHRKTHKKPVPYLGGVAIFIGVVVSLLLVRKNYAAFGTAEFSKITAVVGAGVAAMIFGLIDDKFQVRARSKLAWQILIATAFAVFGYRFEVLRIPGVDPILLGEFAVPFTVFWILTVLNGFNLIDGVDGLAGTVGLVIFGMVALTGIRLGDMAISSVALTAGGATIAFLLLNWKPAKIYLGDAGSTGLGILAAAALIALGNRHGARLLDWGNPPSPSEPFLFQVPAVTMIAIYPVLEVALSVVRRAIRGKSIGSADTAHIHHKLLYQGWSSSSIALAAGGLSLISGLTLWINLVYTRGSAAWLVLLSGALIGSLLHYCGYLRALHPDAIRDTRPHFLIANHFVSMQTAKLSAARSFQDVMEILEQTCAEFGVENLELSLDVGDSAMPKSWKNEGIGARSWMSFSFRRDTAALQLDRVNLPDSKSRAQWSLFPNELEADLKTEHRVLLNNFIRRAVRRLEETYARS